MKRPSPFIMLFGNSLISLVAVGFCCLLAYRTLIEKPEGWVIGVAALFAINWVMAANTMSRRYTDWKRRWDSLA